MDGSEVRDQEEWKSCFEFLSGYIVSSVSKVLFRTKHLPTHVNRYFLRTLALYLIYARQLSLVYTYLCPNFLTCIIKLTSSTFPEALYSPEKK